jgi:hypothetical protein
LDCSDFLIERRRGDHMRGPDGMWSHKMKAIGLDIITPNKVYKKHKIELDCEI